jgi:hypothetical protein
VRAVCQFVALEHYPKLSTSHGDDRRDIAYRAVPSNGKVATVQPFARVREQHKVCDVRVHGNRLSGNGIDHTQAARPDRVFRLPIEMITPSRISLLIEAEQV